MKLLRTMQGNLKTKTKKVERQHCIMYQSTDKSVVLVNDYDLANSFSLFYSFQLM